MSTKTTIKRIALVAAVAAAFGGLSTVAANATSLTYPTIAATSGTTATGGTALTAPTASATVGNYVVDTITSGSADAAYTITSTGVGSLALAAAPSAAVTVATGAITTLNAVVAVVGSDTTHQDYSLNSATSATWYAGTFPGASTFGSTAASVFTFAATSATAGTQTITVTGNSGDSATQTITWGATPVASAQYSTVYIKQGLVTTAPSASDTSVSWAKTAKTASADAAASIFVQLNSAAATAVTGQGLSASVSGPGTIALESNTSASDSAWATNAQPSAGRALSVTAASTVGSKFYLNVWGDGTSGVSTITITSGTTTIGTVSLTFYGSYASVKATQNLNVLKAGGAANAAVAGGAYDPYGDGISGTPATAGEVYSGTLDPAAAAAAAAAVTADLSDVFLTAPISVQVSDANGVGVDPTAADIKVVSSNSAVLVGGSTCSQVTVVGTHETKNAGMYNCYVTGAVGAASGSSATATVELWDTTTSAWDIVSAPLTFTIGGAVTKEALSLDAATYAPGQPFVLTATATDASGNKAYDQDLNTVGSILGSTYINGLASPAGLVNGVATSTGYVPSVEGAFTISGVDNLSTAREALTVTGTVGNGAASAQAAAATDAANEATDAANAATDAANAAADAADAATAAAQDAGAKADAALAAVTALSAKITVLAAQIAKIVKKLGA